MKKHKLTELKEMLDKYELQRETTTGKIRAVFAGTDKVAELSNEEMRDLVFAFSWARAWVEAGFYDYNKPVNERKIPGFDLKGRNMYDALIQAMKNWVNKKDFHYYIDIYKMSEKVQELSNNPNTSRIIFQLFRPDRLDDKKEFYELYETGKITTDLVNNDEMLHKMYKYLMVEAEYKSQKGFQPGE